RSAAHVGPAAPPDGGGRVARAEDAADVDAWLRRNPPAPRHRAVAHATQRISRHDRARDQAARTHRRGPARHRTARERRGRVRAPLFCDRAAVRARRAASSRDSGREDIEIVASVEASADQLFGDPYRLEQVVENLVANAIRHAPDGGRIELEADSVDDTAVIAVTDNGPGIAPEHIEHIFDRFYKVDAARASGTSG